MYSVTPSGCSLYIPAVDGVGLLHRPSIILPQTRLISVSLLLVYSSRFFPSSIQWWFSGDLCPGEFRRWEREGRNFTLDRSTCYNKYMRVNSCRWLVRPKFSEDFCLALRLCPKFCWQFSSFTFLRPNYLWPDNLRFLALTLSFSLIDSFLQISTSSDFSPCTFAHFRDFPYIPFHFL